MSGLDPDTITFHTRKMAAGIWLELREGHLDRARVMANALAQEAHDLEALLAEHGAELVWDESLDSKFT